MEFTGFVTAKRQNRIRYCTVRDWMPGLVLKWTAVFGSREKHPLIAAFLKESALRDDRLASSGGGSSGRLKLRVDSIGASGVAVSKGGGRAKMHLVQGPVMGARSMDLAAD